MSNVEIMKDRDLVQKEFVENDSLVKLCLWPRRAGKSTVLATCILKAVRESKTPLKVVVTSMVKVQAEIILEYIKEKALYSEIEKSTIFEITWSNGSTISVAASGSPSATTLLGTKVDLLIVDNIDHLKEEDWDAFSQVIKPTRIVATATCRESILGEDESYLPSNMRGYKPMFNCTGRKNLVQLLNEEDCFVSMRE